jgi:acyl-CoA thioester hydrolase
MKPYTRRVHYYETDQMGIVHHSNYIRWFEEARVDYMEQLGFGYPESVAAGVDFAVLSVSCAYKSMVRFGESVHIAMEIVRLDRLRMTIAYRVTDALSGELRCTGESTHCYYHGQKRRPVSLQKELPELFALLRAQVPAT